MRRRITVLAMATALLAVVLLAVPLGALAARNYLKDERLELLQAASTCAARVRGDLAGEACSSDPGVSTTVYNRSGRRVVGSGPLIPPPVARTALRGHQASATSDNTLEVAAPVSDGDQVIGTVLLSTSLDDVHHRAWIAWLLLAAMCLAAVAISGIAARLVVVRLTGPIDRLTATARRVGSGDLDARAETSEVAELNVLGAALNDSTRQLQERIGRERAFSAEVSHQLRTPLSALRLALDADNVESARSEVDRLDATITELIRLARDLPSARQVSTAHVLAEVERRWRGRLAAQSRPLRIAPLEDGPLVIAISAAAAEQVLDVLVDNAYTHGRGAITLRTRVSDDTVAIEVSDEGPPLAVEPHELFRRRVEGDGHGLGLPLARRLAEAEGARLVLASSAPPTFALVVPASSPAAHERDPA
jgi:signal transduction histidine kinase